MLMYEREERRKEGRKEHDRRQSQSQSNNQLTVLVVSIDTIDIDLCGQ